VQRLFEIIPGLELEQIPLRFDFQWLMPRLKFHLLECADETNRTKNEFGRQGIRQRTESAQVKSQEWPSSMVADARRINSFNRWDCPHASTYMAIIGKRNQLTVLRSAPPGFYLDGEKLGEILLPGKFVPPTAKVGEKVDVFVYRDSEDRLVATTQKPAAVVGQFALLKVVSVKRGVGVFLDWGLDKDLLLPMREMAGPLNPGEKVLVQIALDERSDRLMASARLSKRLELTPIDTYQPGDAVKLMVLSESPLGYNMIVNDAHRGLLYRNELPGPLEIGQVVEGYVRAVRPDGKLDLAAGRTGPQRIAPAAEQVLAQLHARSDGFMPYHDNSPPERIRAIFGLSKKAFKQAIGSLFREQRIYIEPDGIRLVDPTAKK